MSKPEELTEQAILGAVLRHPPVLEDVLPILRPEHFHAYQHQQTFAAMLALWEQSKPIDLAAVADQLHRTGKLEDLGGYPWLARLWDETPTAAEAVYHARRVRDRALLRFLAQAGREITLAAENPTSPAEQTLEDAERQIFAVAEQGLVGEVVPLSSAIHDAAHQLDERCLSPRPDLSGLPTGFAELDGLTAGLQPSELILVAARPSVGKTAWGLSLLRHVAVEEGQAAFVASLEQSRVELAERLLASQAWVDSHAMRTGNLSPADADRLAEARDVLCRARVFIDDSPRQGMLRIAANARRLKRRHGIALVLVDYLQLIEPEDRRVPRYEQVGQISRRLKQLAREVKVPVVALCQLNRSIEERSNSTPRLADLRESGSLEMDADTVLLLHRAQAVPGPVQPIAAILAKQRNGPIGNFPLDYHKPYVRFQDSALPDSAFPRGPTLPE